MMPFYSPPSNAHRSNLCNESLRKLQLMPPQPQPLSINIQRNGKKTQRKLNPSHRVEEILRPLFNNPIIDELREPVEKEILDHHDDNEDLHTDWLVCIVDVAADADCAELCSSLHCPLVYDVHWWLTQREMGEEPYESEAENDTDANDTGANWDQVTKKVIPETAEDSDTRDEVKTELRLIFPTIATG
jgi:hypothetical protein